MKRRTVCLYLDSSLVDEARKAAEARGASLSELAEEAISLYLQLLDQLRFDQLRTPRRAARGRPAAEAPTARPPQPSAPSPPPPTTPPSPTPPAPQLPPSAPPHLQNNAWVAVLRSRR